MVALLIWSFVPAGFVARAVPCVCCSVSETRSPRKSFGGTSRRDVPRVCRLVQALLHDGTVSIFEFTVPR